MTAPTAPTARDQRIRDLAAMPKHQLIAIYRPYCLWSAHPLEQWSKDELVGSVLDIEFPPAEGTDHQ